MRARVFQEDSHTHRIQCGWLRRALPPQHAGQLCQTSLYTAYYRGTQCSRMRRIHAEPVCRIKWIRQHVTFPSCRLRRKLHGRSATLQASPQATPGAVSTRQGKARRSEDPRGQARQSRNEISFACNAIMYEQYDILYYIVWAHLSGTQRPCTRLP